MTVAPPSPPYVGPLPRTGGGGNKPIKRVVMHCTAGAEPGQAGAARGTVAYTKRSGVVSSYHYVADARESLQAVWDSTVAYHCGTNSNSIGYELSCSLSNEGRGHWGDSDHQAMLRIAARDVARLCLHYGVRIRFIGKVRLRLGQTGITGHVNMRNAFGNTTHWDPGPHFPWREFIRMVRLEADALTHKPNEPEPDPPPPEPPVVDPPNRRQTHLLLGGDWNEPSTSRGRFTPHWIARQGRMTVHTAPELGIDYVLSSASVENMRRIGRGGSDHPAIAFTVVNPTDPLLSFNGAIFNVERDRSDVEQQQLVAWLAYEGAQHDLDFWLLQEVRQYHGTLANVPGYRLFASREPVGAEHNAILVRDGIDVKGVRFRQTSDAGWFTKTGATHDPTNVALATLNGWLRVGSVHEVVSTDIRGGKWLGPVRRVAARISSARTLAKLARRWRGESSRRKARR